MVLARKEEEKGFKQIEEAVVDVSIPRQLDAIPAHEAVKSAAPEADVGVSASFSFSSACFLMLLLSLVASP